MPIPRFRCPMRLALAVLAAALLLSPGLLFANGRATLVATEKKGPYVIDISILPGSAVVANTHMSILVRSSVDEQVLTDAKVAISATGPPSATALESLPASNDTTPQFYEATVPFDLEGDWEVLVRVRSELGEETVLIPMYVHPGGSNINWILLAALAVFILAVGVWTWDRVAGRNRRTGQA